MGADPDQPRLQVAALRGTAQEQRRQAVGHAPVHAVDLAGDRAADERGHAAETSPALRSRVGRARAHGDHQQSLPDHVGEHHPERVSRQVDVGEGAQRDQASDSMNTAPPIRDAPRLGHVAR